LAQYRRPSPTGQEGSWLQGPNPAIVPPYANGSRDYGDSPETK
jgi:hypothetical protein